MRRRTLLALHQKSSQFCTSFKLYRALDSFVIEYRYEKDNRKAVDLLEKQKKKMPLILSGSGGYFLLENKSI